MKGNIEERACELAAYIIENRATVREAARRFGISKSTVHMDVIKWNGGRYDRDERSRRIPAGSGRYAPVFTMEGTHHLRFPCMCGIV